MTPEGPFEVEQVQRAISEADAGWVAGSTAFTEMSSDERALWLGYTPGPDDPSLEEDERTAQANLQAFRAAMAARAPVAEYPSAYDLRDVDGKNFITEVKDQGSCGSCVAFGVAAAAEGRLRVQRNDPDLAVDYSEAHLFHCHARSQGRRCGHPHPKLTWGWWPAMALRAFRRKGVVDEACYPYTPADQDCANLCSDWQSRVTKISGWHRIGNTAKMKEWISSKGPLTATYTVYEDFFSYRGGVYTHVRGESRGGHCVCCVGYDDDQQYWICKNSWGPGFGENGYFRIAYGQCGIDSAMHAVEGIAETGWVKDVRIDGLWAVNQNRNAWAHVAGLGWRKISPDKDSVFFVMLAQLAAAKAGNRRVDFLQEDGVIKQVYVF